MAQPFSTETTPVTSWTPRSWAAWMATPVGEQASIIDEQILRAEKHLHSARQRVLARS